VRRGGASQGGERMKRPTRRTIIKVIALLAAGATLNIAVAWGCEYWLLGESAQQLSVEQAELAFKEHAGPLELANMDDPLPTCRGIYHLFERVHTRAPRGWPLRCVGGQIANVYRSEKTTHLITALPIAGPGPPVRFSEPAAVLPYGPLWPGFAVNTLFYAGVLWVLFCGPFALRRMIRRRRGRCAQCAYPVGSSAVCTECGAALHQCGAPGGGVIHATPQALEGGGP